VLVCSEAAKELKQRALAIMAQAEEAARQAQVEARMRQEAEHRLMEDNTLEDEPDDLQGIRFEEKTLERGDAAPVRVRPAGLLFR
jgi:hypothetical protein